MRRVAHVALLVIGLVLASVAGAVSYTIVDLGTLGGLFSDGYSVNNAGQVTGSAYTAEIGAWRAFLYSGGVMTDIGTLGGNPTGRGINSSGQVAGESYLGFGTSGGAHAFLYSGGVMKDIDTSGGQNSAASSINNFGQVTGYLGTADGAHAFLYSGGAMTDLGIGPHSYGLGINDSGQVTGYLQTADGATHAFLYSGGVMTDLGTLNGKNSAGYSINNSGQVTGSADTAFARHAFLYSGGVMTDLGTLGGTQSEGLSINNSGEVTGVSTTDGVNGPQRAFLYSDGVMTDLNSLIPSDSGWTLVVGRGINDAGQITGSGIINGVTHAFLATPVTIVPPVVPVISSLDPTSMVADGLAHTLTINGSNFASGNQVQFNFTGSGGWVNALSAPTISSNQITISMNPGTVTNNILVRVCRSVSQTTTSDCSAQTVSVSVTAVPPAPPLPKITMISPATGPAGAEITLFGANFGATQGTGVVKFDAVTAAIKANTWSDGNIIAIAPAGLSGQVSIKVATTAGTSDGVTFGYPLPPAFTVTPTFWDFGTISVKSSRTKTISLTNTGGPGLQIANLTLLGFNKEAFSISDNGCSGAIPQSGCSFKVTFAPTDNVTSAAHVTLSSNAASSISNVGLYGIGGTPAEEKKAADQQPKKPWTLDFGDIAHEGPPLRPPLIFKSPKVLDIAFSSAANEELTDLTAGAPGNDDQCFVSTIETLKYAENHRYLNLATMEAADTIVKAAIAVATFEAPIANLFLNTIEGLGMASLQNKPIGEPLATGMLNVAAEFAKYALRRLVAGYLGEVGGYVVEGFNNLAKKEINDAFAAEKNVTWRLTDARDPKSAHPYSQNVLAAIDATVIYDPYSHYITAVVAATCTDLNTRAVVGRKLYPIVFQITNGSDIYSETAVPVAGTFRLLGTNHDLP